MTTKCSQSAFGQTDLPQEGRDALQGEGKKSVVSASRCGGVKAPAQAVASSTKPKAALIGAAASQASEGGDEEHNENKWGIIIFWIIVIVIVIVILWALIAKRRHHHAYGYGYGGIAAPVGYAPYGQTGATNYLQAIGAQ